MEIIRKGWSLEVTCQNNLKFNYRHIKLPPNIDNKYCGSLLKVNMDDISYASYFYSSDGTGYEVYFYITCPVCGSRIYIDNDLIPEFIKEYVCTKKE